LAPIFVRHGRSLSDDDVPTQEWPLDPDGHVDIAKLAQRVPSLPIVSSDMRRAIETAEFFGVPTVDARLAEVSRPLVNERQDSVAAYFSGQMVEGWEAQSDAIARIEASVAEHGDAIYVTHGTILSLFMASRCPGLDAYDFWAHLQNPDAWTIQDSRAVKLG
jgi:broad specificity phosphatase PhoE